MATILVLILGIMILILLTGLFVLEAFLALRKNLYVGLIMPIIFFAIALLRLISMIQLSSVTFIDLIPTITFVIHCIIYICCRLYLRHKEMNRVRNDIKRMQINDI